MTSKALLQTLGTVSSLVLAFITINFTKPFHVILFGTINIPVFILQSILFIATVSLMILTGFSYYNSSSQHNDFTSSVYLCLGIAQSALAPIAFVFAFSKIEFGEYWWSIIIGILILTYCGIRYIGSQT